jgi:hypothetical protein
MSPSRAATKKWPPLRRIVPVNDKGEITFQRATGWIIHPEDRAVRPPAPEKQSKRHNKARKGRAKGAMT